MAFGWTEKPLPVTLGLLQGWLDIGAMVILSQSTSAGQDKLCWAFVC
jgi:hypothetical protein